MIVHVLRTKYGVENGIVEGATAGIMLVDGMYFGRTLEDQRRQGPKVPGRTCIPAGKYQLVHNHSNHFNKELPQLLNVPGFEGVRIHGGNKPEDSEGCILLAKNFVSWGNIQGSLSDEFEAKLAASGGTSTIEIIDGFSE